LAGPAIRWHPGTRIDILALIVHRRYGVASSEREDLNATSAERYLRSHHHFAVEQIYRSDQPRSSMPVAVVQLPRTRTAIFAGGHVKATTAAAEKGRHNEDRCSDTNQRDHAGGRGAHTRTVDESVEEAETAGHGRDNGLGRPEICRAARNGNEVKLA
jgi:hypothetical protein